MSQDDRSSFRAQRKAADDGLLIPSSAGRFTHSRTLSLSRCWLLRPLSDAPEFSCGSSACGWSSWNPSRMKCPSGPSFHHYWIGFSCVQPQASSRYALLSTSDSAPCWSFCVLCRAPWQRWTPACGQYPVPASLPLRRRRYFFAPPGCVTSAVEWPDIAALVARLAYCPRGPAEHAPAARGRQRHRPDTRTYGMTCRNLPNVEKGSESGGQGRVSFPRPDLKQL